jgi:glutamate N-acetyltransferase/amino-acid N-acetyltransferase
MTSIEGPGAAGALKPVAGVRVGAAASGIGYPGRPDLLLAAFGEGATVAGVLTSSTTAAAPLRWTRERLARGDAPRGLVVNAGNANCFTGAAGMRAVEETAAHAARLLGCRPEQVYIASTGKIGVPIDMAKMRAGLDAAHGALARNDWTEASRAIMTTDRFPKAIAATAEIGGAAVTLQGISKGNMMIAPSMATTLSFLFTDARLPADAMRPALADAAADTYNMMSVDTTQSTNDTLLLFATDTGGAGTDLRDFRAKLNAILAHLSQRILEDARRDGVLVRIHVSGAESPAAARHIACQVRDSIMVRKMAGQGDKLVLGRIIASVGMSSEKVDQDRLRLAIGGRTVSRDGGFTDGFEVPKDGYMSADRLDIDIDVGVGAGEATAYTVAGAHL